MSRGAISESHVEEAALEFFRDLGYDVCHGPDIAPGGTQQERDRWDEVVLRDRLMAGLARVNPSLPREALEAAAATLLRPESQNVMAENWRVHRLMTQGVPVSYRNAEGDQVHGMAWVFDFANPANNEYLAVNQFTVTENGRSRRPDIVIFVNGVPIAVLELKDPGDENATLRGAWNQIQTYRNDIPALFPYNILCIASDGLQTVMGAFDGGFEHFAPWKTIDGREIVTDRPSLEVLIRGVFARSRLLDLMHNFVVFTDEPDGLVKRVAKYHQYWAVNAAVESTIAASRPHGDRRGGVVWHTQGSGKSIEMLLYAAKIMREPAMENPTLVFVTDRNDLDGQLFGEVFAPARILPERPVQAGSRADLREKLHRASGGIIFTTLQKFAPEVRGDVHALLSDRRNVVVIADEAHRSQYDFLDGYARHLRDALPNATYLGFTGTPIEGADKSTKEVFGEYIDIYDLTRAVEDGATVRIFYESRLAKVGLPTTEVAELDEQVDELAEGRAPAVVEAAKTKWARVEAIVGAAERLDVVARDIVQHWEARRTNLMGKAMIVCMSRRICVDMYRRIVALRPTWHDPDPKKGRIKVVMTGSAADPQEYQPHLHSKEVLRDIKLRAKDPADVLELVIVRDMWLTGFDAPAVHTMYVDKPMQGVGLMQAIARVNRTFKDKPGGLVVDYLGIAQKLREALADYSQSDRDKAGVPIEEVVEKLLEKHDIVKGILHGHRWSSDTGRSAHERLQQLHDTEEFVLADPDRRQRYSNETYDLLRLFALTGARDEAMAIRHDVRFFADVRGAIAKLDSQGLPGQAGAGGSEEIDTAIAQMVSEAVTSEGVVDIFAAAGIERPDISILSDAFLDGLGKAGRPNIEIAALRKFLAGQVRHLQRKNLVRARKFSTLLEAAILKYQNRALTAAEIILELVKLAKEMRGDQARNVDLNLSEDEVAFYDAIRENGAAVIQMGDDTLKAIARDLVVAVRTSATIDWQFKESVRAGMRSKVKRLLSKYGYPPDQQDEAVRLVIEQAEHSAKAQVAE